MKKLFQFIFLIGVFLTFASWIRNRTDENVVKKFTVSGSIMQTVSYCGGASPSQQMLDSCNKPRGIRFAKLFVKAGRRNIEGARVLKTIDADSSGNFKISLPAGIYCLVEEWKSRSFKLPLNDARHTVDSACFRNLYNSSDFELRVTDKNIHDLKIIFHRTCFYNQPCISYRGPLPSIAAPQRH